MLPRTTPALWLGIEGLTAERGGRILGFEAMRKEHDWSAFAVACALFGASWIAGGRGSGQDLLGPLTKEQILNVLPECGFERNSYGPAAAALDKIRSAGVAIRIEAYFASSDAEQVKWIGRLMKIQEAADPQNLAVDYAGLAGTGDSLAAAKSLDKLPAFVIFIDGVETGRLSGSFEPSLEEALVSFLPQPPATEDDPPETSEDAIYADRDYFRGILHAHLPIDCTRCHMPRRNGP